MAIQTPATVTNVITSWFKHQRPVRSIPHQAGDDRSDQTNRDRSDLDQDQRSKAHLPG
jgi:hypothetical protein